MDKLPTLYHTFTTKVNEEGLLKTLHGKVYTEL